MKKLLTILVLIMLIISFFQITSMYALYKEEIQGEYNTLLGVWAIKVNGTDISSGEQNLTFSIGDDQLQYIESDYIQAGKIAPNGQAYFDIVIDPTDTDVSIVYKIDVDTNATSNSTTPNTDITNAIELERVENYLGQGDDGQTNKTTNETLFKDGNLYTSVIPVNMITQGYKNYIRLFFKWKNVVDENAIDLNNEADTAIGSTKNAKISIPIQINLKQYTGEVIGNESE